MNRESSRYLTLFTSQFDSLAIMSIARLNLTGGVYPFEGDISAALVLDFFMENEEATDFEFTLNTPGGSVSEAFAIADIIRNESKGRPVTIIGYQVMSAGTIIHLAADKDKRLISPNVEYMIHNPWNLAGGDKDSLRKAADRLERVENKVLSYYETHTGTAQDVIQPLMSDETFLTVEQLLELGFASAVLEVAEVKQKPLFASAVASYTSPKERPTLILKPVKQNHMSTQEKENKLLSRIDALLSKVPGIGTPQNLVVALQDGRNLEIRTTEAKAQVGDEVKVDKKGIEDGEYMTANTKEVFVIKNSKIAEIRDESGDTETETAKDLEGAQAAFMQGLEKLSGKMSARMTALEGYIQGYEAGVANLLKATETLTNKVEALTTKMESKDKTMEEQAAAIEALKKNRYSRYSTPHSSAGAQASNTGEDAFTPPPENGVREPELLTFAGVRKQISMAAKERRKAPVLDIKTR